MANCLDIVPVRIKHECCIVVWMILRAKARHAVFNSADGQTGSEENIDIRSRSRTESDVDARCHRTALRYPKVTSRIGAFPMSFHNSKAGCSRTVLTKNITKRSQDLKIKCFAFPDVTDSNPHMVNHQLTLLVETFVSFVHFCLRRAHARAMTADTLQQFIRDSPDGSSQSPTMVAQGASDRDSGPGLSLPWNSSFRRRSKLTPERRQFRVPHRDRHDRTPASPQCIDSYIRIGVQDV